MPYKPPPVTLSEWPSSTAIIFQSHPCTHNYCTLLCSNTSHCPSFSSPLSLFSTVTPMALELLVWMKYMRSLACPGEAVGKLLHTHVHPTFSESRYGCLDVVWGTVIENNLYFSNLLILDEDHPVVLSPPSHLYFCY